MPIGVTSGAPPLGKRASDWPAPLWQERHPPMLNMSSPFRESPLCLGNSANVSGRGSLRNQNNIPSIASDASIFNHR